MATVSLVEVSLVYRPPGPTPMHLVVPAALLNDILSHIAGDVFSKLGIMCRLSVVTNRLASVSTPVTSLL